MDTQKNSTASAAQKKNYSGKYAAYGDCFLGDMAAEVLSDRRNGSERHFVTGKDFPFAGRESA